MRGRSRNKGPNPLTRSYESNGPDVKIRGTAQHIADKYAQLARDAQASGDPVAAENYLQHAEHYYRIIAAAQEQFRDQYGSNYQRPFDEDGDEDAGAGMNGHNYAGPGGGDDGYPPMQPQPYEGRGENGERGERPQRFERGDRPDRERFGNRQDRGERQDRGDRQGRDRFPRGDRQDFQRSDFQRQDGQRQDGQRQDGQRQDREPRRERRPEPSDEGGGGLPAFLTTPVRAPINVEEGGEAQPPATFDGDEAAGEPNGRYGVRPRRRRRSRYGNGSGDEGAAEPGSDFAPEGVEPSGE